MAIILIQQKSKTLFRVKGEATIPQVELAFLVYVL